jgi:hypothetical protein
MCLCSTIVSTMQVALFIKRKKSPISGILNIIRSISNMEECSHQYAESIIIRVCRAGGKGDCCTVVECSLHQFHTTS